MGLTLSAEDQQCVANYHQSMVYLFYLADAHCQLPPEHPVRPKLARLQTQMRALQDPALLMPLAARWHQLCEPASRQPTVAATIEALQAHADVGLPAGMAVRDLLHALGHCAQEHLPKLHESFVHSVGWAQQMEALRARVGR